MEWMIFHSYQSYKNILSPHNEMQFTNGIPIVRIPFHWGLFVSIVQPSKRLVQNPYISYVQDFCVYALRSLQNRCNFLLISVKQGRSRGKREASAKRKLRASPHARNSRFALASLSPLFPWNTPVLQAKRYATEDALAAVERTCLSLPRYLCLSGNWFSSTPAQSLARLTWSTSCMSLTFIVYCQYTMKVKDGISAHIQLTLSAMSTKWGSRCGW